MGPQQSLVDLALRFPDVVLVLAHCGIADQGVFATNLREHPNVYYDTSVLAASDIVELFARVPAERIMFASDVPYGRPVGGLFAAMRAAARAGLDESERLLMAGGRMQGILDGAPRETPTAPRLPRVRPVEGSLLRIEGCIRHALGSVVAIAPFDPLRATEGIALARAVCRDPEAGAAVQRIDALLAACEELLTSSDAMLLFGMLHAALTIAATEDPTT
jgi:hypothetical protein